MNLRFQRTSKAGHPLARFFLVGVLALGLSGCQDPNPEPSKNPKEPPTLDRELSRRLHRVINARAEETPNRFTDYEGEISDEPRTRGRYQMVAIEGGEFDMGSLPDEPGRTEDEGPVHRVRVSSFWMGKHEVSWNQFEPFMIHAYDSGRNPDSFEKLLKAEDDRLIDWISGPSEILYGHNDFGMGIDDFPAVGITQHTASKFCQWLSARTGHFYRLPTEAEWEYACRAGTTTAYHFGNDPAKLGDYDFFDPEQDRNRYRKIGQGQPNPWGLFDMHGNVIEWCLDCYVPDLYAKRSGLTIDPLVKASRRFPRVARGGSWYDSAEWCRSADRTASSPDWSQLDPRVPKSLWWHPDAAWLGFRIIRPLKIPEADEMHDLWNSYTEDEEETSTPPAL